MSPEEWAELMQVVPDESIRMGLAAHANWALKKVGGDLGSSFPRSLDKLRALAKAKSLKPYSDAEYRLRLSPTRDISTGVRAHGNAREGARTWSF